jgi:hypothetical protein
MIRYNIINELVDNQLNKETIPKSYKLYYTDILRLSSKLNSSIFTDSCCLWLGYINTNIQINFQLNKNRRSLQRIIYINYIDSSIKSSDIIIATCENKNICCSVKHLKIKNDI